MKFISICSGIDAASVAFAPLGWSAIAFSEIEPFPCAVLAHHYPSVPNLGDMTKFREWPEQLFIDADAIVGGPPCQAFSVAGLRNGLNDERGNLTLTYAEMIDHADSIRVLHGKPPIVFLYENVPGLLSDKTGAFGSLLAALAGEDVRLESPRKRWTDAGAVRGPKRELAWRTLDAQFFGVPQQRRRLFIVGSNDASGLSPIEVLFEPTGSGLHLAQNDGSKVQGQRLRRDHIAPAFTRNYARGVHCGGEGYIMELGGRLRRFTPLEVERLFGFPDNYTAIPWRKKPASECPDGPRYKALGNSWAVPVVRWIGSRIASQLANPAPRRFF